MPQSSQELTFFQPSFQVGSCLLTPARSRSPMCNSSLWQAVRDVLTPGAPVVKERIQTLQNDQLRVAKTLQMLEQGANAGITGSTNEAAEFKR